MIGNNTTMTTGTGQLPPIPDYMVHYNNSVLLQLVVLGISSVFGIAGNALVLATGLRRIWVNFGGSASRSRQEYKQAFIMNLAITDILNLVYGVPFHLSQEKMVPLSEFVCRFLAPMKDVLSLATVLTIMTISVERTIAIISPFALEKAHRRTKCGIAFIWTTAYLLAGLPMVFVMYSTENKQCYLNWKDEKLAVVHQTSAALLIIVPGLITTVCYMFCLRALHNLRQRRESTNDAIEQWTFIEQTRSVSRIALVLVGIYWLCNLPLVTYAICLHYKLISPSLNVHIYTRAILFCLFFGTNVINPIVLIAMSPLYRRSASDCLNYLFSNVLGIIRPSRGKTTSYSSETANRLERSTVANEFALVSRNEITTP